MTPEEKEWAAIMRGDDNRGTWPWWAWVIVSAIALFICVALVGVAMAHQAGLMTYPPRCCYGSAINGDCAPIEGIGLVQRRADGWFIKETGETIPFAQAETSTDLRFHRCKRPDNSTRCFFAPDSGT